MTDMYRLAVVERNTGPEAVVERNGMLVPITTLLGEQARGLGSFNDLMPLLLDWPRWSSAIERRLPACAGLFEAGTPVAQAKFRAPLQAPGKIVCIGANYHDHIAEMPIPMIPKYPYSFLKPGNNTLRGSGDPVSVPRAVRMMDFEAELAAIIGVRCAHVPASDALGVVAGYANFNDLSARDQLASRPAVGVDWVWHKAFDGFAPFGPYLLPSRFVSNPQDLKVRLMVNGEIKQNSSTSQMIFGVAAIIEHLSSIMTLYPGDIIATGTAAGVGHGRKPPEYLAAGDEIRMEVGLLGELVTPIV